MGAAKQTSRYGRKRARAGVLTSRIAQRWRFVPFRGPVDVLAIRKDSSKAAHALLKSGDLFETILAQMKGSGARIPNSDVVPLPADEARCLSRLTVVPTSGSAMQPKGYFSQTDPFGFSAAFLSVGNLFSTGLNIAGNPATGNLWVNLSRTTLTKLQGNGKLVMNQSALSKNNVQSFARFLTIRSNSEQIPWVFGPLSLIPVVGTVITIATSAIDGLQKISRGSVNSDQLAVLMADGGTFLQTLALEGTERVMATVFYSVKVGTESRLYGICSSTYGLNVVG
jgi:hypothetical protein